MSAPGAAPSDGLHELASLCLVHRTSGWLIRRTLSSHGERRRCLDDLLVMSQLLKLRVVWPRA